jgi:hypothetical protein
MSHVNPKHPANDGGAIMWARNQLYLCGDRSRGTIIMVIENGVLEMTPEWAKSFAEEILFHASDVEGCGPVHSQANPEVNAK